MRLCLHLYVGVAVLGEEQELDLSPLRKRLARGPPARGLSGVCVGGYRKQVYSPLSDPSVPSLAVLLVLSLLLLRPTSIRQESSEGEESSRMSTISDIIRDPLSMETKMTNYSLEKNNNKFLICEWFPVVSLTFSAEGGRRSSLARQLSAMWIKHGCLGGGGEKCQRRQIHTCSGSHGTQAHLAWNSLSHHSLIRRGAVGGV